MRRSSIFSVLRITLLLALMGLLLLYGLLASPSSVHWETPVRVRIYPIAADARPETARYIATLKQADFQDIETFFAREARRYRLGLEWPIRVELAPPMAARPPRVPREPSILEALWWAVRMRFWVWREDGGRGGDTDVRIFMSFYAPDNPQGLQHSLGLQKGMIGLVNGFAAPRSQGINNFVAAHELLHTLGATDKYDMDSGKPLWPDGFADPVQAPLFPQHRAEIMGGRVQISPAWSLLPPSLEHAVVGAATAIEIGWLAGGIEARER